MDLSLKATFRFLFRSSTGSGPQEMYAAFPGLEDAVARSQQIADTVDLQLELGKRHFPTFNGLRGAMYEESILFFTDLFQNDRSVLNILDADYTFLNEALAKHYGIPGVTGPEWRRTSSSRSRSDSKRWTACTPPRPSTPGTTCHRR